MHIPRDTCIRAGDVLNAIISGTDDSIKRYLTLTATGVPLELATLPATFDSISGQSVLSQHFIWNTDCDDIQLQPYQVYFKVEDDYVGLGYNGLAPFHLQDIETWQINVIPPPVLGLTGHAVGNSVLLNWDSIYLCSSPANPNFRGFSVWRRLGCDSFVPSYCETGLAGTGYVKITTTNTPHYYYTDNGLVPGQAYSYRVLAEFYNLPPSGLISEQYNNQESVTSNEVCVVAAIDVPALLNVDVDQTDPANGQIYVRWAKPLAGGPDLDTAVHLPPYKFYLYREQGNNFGNPPSQQISNWTYNSYANIPDTISLFDGGMNTQQDQWAYEVSFFATDSITGNPDSIGVSAPASSIFLRLQPSSGTLTLVWNYNDPWTNDSFTIYKLINNTYDSIGVAYANQFADTGLINDSTYCYYVKGYGYYPVSDSFPAPLINKSERICGIAVDTSRPCPPVLTVQNDCNIYNTQPWNVSQYINQLVWNDREDSCARIVSHYRIYYGVNDSTPLTFLDSTNYAH